MSGMNPANAASVMARLQNEAKRTGEPFNATLDRYVGFRLLYRLTRSRFADRFMLKGATMFLFWFGAMHRPSRDFDLLGTMADIKELKRAFIEDSMISCPEDGVIFDVAGINAQPIREEQAYGGVRITLVGYIGTVRIPVQVDVGFGDAVTPGPQTVAIPAMIRDVPGCTIASYPVETAFAEKV